jgi:exodeoxyribonuclease VII large subunit
METFNAIRLAELSAHIETVIKEAYREISFWVIADITNHTFKPSSNYHYFELVEKDTHSNELLARFSSKAWGPGSRQIEQFEKATGQRFSNNIHVLVQVRVEYHAVYGLQLQLIGIDPHFTLGLIEQQKQATLDRLVAENPDTIRREGEEYFTRNKSLALNPVIQSIAVISSGSSAGLQDFIHTLDTNGFGYRFRIDEYHTEVQGDSNAASFRNKLIGIYQSGITYDAIVITRGGGAQTDLLLFDNYLIGQAIARIPIPVITGIGHHKNTTIADLMAHTSTKTPTQSAEFIIAHNRRFEEDLLELQNTVIIKSQQLCSLHGRTLTQLQTRISHNSRDLLNAWKDRLQLARQTTLQHTQTILYERKASLVDISGKLSVRPRIMVAEKQQSLRNLLSNLEGFKSRYFKNQEGYLTHYIALIRLVSPENTLRRGFALVKYKDRIMARGETIPVGAEISVLLHDQELGAIVHKKTDQDGRQSDI